MAPPICQEGERQAGAPGQPHGRGPCAQRRHARIFTPILDSDIFLGGGMGMGAYLGIQDNGIRPIVTEIESVDEAVKATKRATVFDQVDRLH
jgi:hypothetical protein